MPDLKISQLPLQLAPSTTDVLAIVNAGATQKIDIQTLLDAGVGVLVARKEGPTFTGTVTIPTVASIDNTTTAASTAHVKALIASGTVILGDGTTATTQLANDNSTKLSTTAYIDTALGLRVSTLGTTPMLGDLDLNSNKIINLVDPVSAQHAATKNYVDTKSLENATIFDDYDPTITNSKPLTHSTQSESPFPLAGARYFITVAATMNVGTPGELIAQVGDILEARVDNPVAAGAGQWTLVQANSVQATTSLIGITAFSTDAEALAEVSLIKAVTPSNLAALGATTTFAGFAEIATLAEAVTGTDTSRYITPEILASRLSSGGFQTAKVTISSAELLALFTASKSLISAPGANKAIQILDIAAFNNFNAAAYSAGANTLDILYDGGATRWRFSNSFIENASDITSTGYDLQTGTTEVQISQNTALIAQITTADPTLGDGTITLSIHYRIIDFS